MLELLEKHPEKRAECVKNLHKNIEVGDHQKKRLDPHLLLCGSASWFQLFSIWIRIRKGRPKNTSNIFKSLIKSLCITIFCTSHLKKKKIQILALRNSPDPHLSMRIRILTAFLNADPGGFGSETLFKRNFSTKHGLYFTFIIEQRNHYFSIEVGTGI